MSSHINVGVLPCLNDSYHTLRSTCLLWKCAICTFYSGLMLLPIWQKSLNWTHYRLTLSCTATHHTWGWIYPKGLSLCLDSRRGVPWEGASGMCLLMLGAIRNCLLAAHSRLCEDRRSLPTVNRPVSWRRNKVPKNKTKRQIMKRRFTFSHHKPLILGLIGFFLCTDLN